MKRGPPITRWLAESVSERHLCVQDGELTLQGGKMISDHGQEKVRHGRVGCRSAWSYRHAGR
jgi:hypothetical protein